MMAIYNGAGGDAQQAAGGKGKKDIDAETEEFLVQQVGMADLSQKVPCAFCSFKAWLRCFSIT